ncbi:MAG: hypothetical protein GY822_18910 [Deltaproteobacteria bacterium]|nr:hypothetical protein [Deltaproteobacteria bacterium]
MKSTAPFTHLGLQLDVPDSWQNASTLLVVGPPEKQLADVVTIQILPANTSLLDALNEHSGASLDGVEVLKQEDVRLTLGEGKKIEIAMKVSGEQLVRSTLVVNREDRRGDRHLVVVSITQSQKKYDENHTGDVELFLQTLSWND